MPKLFKPGHHEFNSVFEGQPAVCVQITQGSDLGNKGGGLQYIRGLNLAKY